MANPKIADRVKDTSTTTGTGTLTLANSAPTGYQTFGSAFADGDIVDYCIQEQSGSAWEVGIGTFDTTGPTLSRDTILASSNSNNAVNFGAGTKDVFCTTPASRLSKHGPPGHPGFASTKVYGILATTNSTINANLLYANPWYIHERTTIGSIQIFVSTGVAATAARLGIYSNLNGGPDTLLLDAGTVATTASGAQSITISETLEPGWYWGVVVSNGAPTLRAHGTGADGPLVFWHGAHSAWTIHRAVNGNHTYGALPSTFPSHNFVNAAGPVVAFTRA